MDDLLKSSAGDDKSPDTSTMENAPATKAATELAKLTGVIATLNANLINFATSSDRYSRKLIYLTWTLIAFTIVLVAATIWLIADAHKQAAAWDNIALNQQFFTSENEAIGMAMARHEPILEPKGKFAEQQLNHFLSEFETIDSAYDAGLLTVDDLCISFSYYIQLAGKDAEVQNYLKNNPDFFGGFEELTRVVSNSKNPNCH